MSDAALLIDIGNTRIKSALWRRGALTAASSLAWREAPPEVLFERLWGDDRADCRPRRALCCNVAAAALGEALARWCRQRWDIDVEFFTSAAEFDGLRCAYAEPAHLGDDRWLALIGARASHGEPLCVIDCGTATTFDLLGRDGRHLGGAILPGVRTMRAALASNTTLPEAGGAPQPFSADTVPAIAGGTAYALAGAIERLSEEARLRLGEVPQHVLCGGEAAMLTPLLRIDAIQHPQLVLTGLAVAARLI